MNETQYDAIEIDLKEIFWVVVRNAKWIALAAVFGLLISLGVTYLFIPPKYTSNISLYVNNTSETAKAAGTVMNINDITASQKLVNTYIVILQDDEVMEQVAARLLEEYDQQSLESIISLSPDGLRSSIAMSAVNNTEVLSIQANTTNAQLSARICTIMTEIAPEVLQRVVKAGSVEVIGQAKPAASPSSPNMPLNLLIGFFAGVLVAAAFFILRHMLNNTIKDEEDLKARFDVPILGEVPDFTTARKDGYKEYGYN